MSTSLITKDGDERVDLPTEVIILSSEVTTLSTVITVPLTEVVILSDDVTTELASLRNRRHDIALTLLMYLRDHQVAQPFEVHLEQVSGYTIHELLQRDGADLRIRERIEAGDSLVRARYVLQLLYRFYGFGFQAMLERDSHIMCTVALGGGDEHWFKHGAEQLRLALKCSPALSQMLGVPLMLEQIERPVAQDEDTSECFAFLYRPWYLRWWDFLVQGG